MLTNLLVKLNPMKWENIKPTLTIFWKGMVAIFAVILIIILAVQLVNYTINKVEAKKKEKAERQRAEQEEADKRL